MTQDTNKHGAATAALSYIKDGMSLGIGTGSTVDVFIEVLQPLAGKLGPIVSSSARSTKRLAELGMQAVELGSTGDLTLHTVIATVLGVFFSVLLGCGLFAAAFFSSKSGLDEDIGNATRSQRDEHEQ